MTIFVSRTIFCFLFVLCIFDISSSDVQAREWGGWGGGGGVVGVCPTPSLISALSMLHCFGNLKPVIMFDVHYMIHKVVRDMTLPGQLRRYIK